MVMKGFTNESVWAVFSLIILVITGTLFYAIFSTDECDALATHTIEEVRSAIECAASEGVDPVTGANCSTEATIRLCQQSEKTIVGQGFLQAYYGLNVPDYMIYFKKFPKLDVSEAYKYAPFFIQWSESYPFERAGIGQRMWDGFRMTFTEFKEHSKTSYLSTGCTEENGLCFNARGQEQVVYLDSLEYPIRMHRNYKQFKVDVDPSDISDAAKSSWEKFSEGNIIGGVGAALTPLGELGLDIAQTTAIEVRMSVQEDPNFHLISPCYGKIDFRKERSTDENNKWSTLTGGSYQDIEGTVIVGYLEKYNTGGSNYCFADEDTLDAVFMAYMSEVRCVEIDVALTILSGGSKAAVRNGVEKAAKESGEEISKEVLEKIAKEGWQASIKKYGRVGILKKGATKAGKRELAEFAAGFTVKTGAEKYGMKFVAKETASKAFSDIIKTQLSRQVVEFGSDEIQDTLVKVIRREFGEEVSEEVVQKVAKKVGSEITTKKISKEVFEESLEEIGEKVGKEISQELGSEVGEKVSKEVLRDGLSKEVAQASFDKARDSFKKSLSRSMKENIGGISTKMAVQKEVVTDFILEDGFGDQIRREFGDEAGEQIIELIVIRSTKDLGEGRVTREGAEEVIEKMVKELSEVSSEITEDEAREVLTRQLNREAVEELDFLMDDAVGMGIFEGVELGFEGSGKELTGEAFQEAAEKNSDEIMEIVFENLEKDLGENLGELFARTSIASEIAEGSMDSKIKQGAVSYMLRQEVARREGIPTGKDALAVFGWPCIDVDVCRGLGACIETAALWPGFPFADLGPNDMDREKVSTYSANMVFEQCCYNYNYQESSGGVDADYLICEEPYELSQIVKIDVDSERYDEDPDYDLNMTALAKYLDIREGQIDEWCGMLKSDNHKDCVDTEEILAKRLEYPLCTLEHVATFDFARTVITSNVIINIEMSDYDCKSTLLVQGSMDKIDWEDLYIVPSHLIRDDMFQVKMNDEAGYKFRYFRVFEEPAAAAEYCYIDDVTVTLGSFTEATQAKIGEAYELNPFSFNYFVVPGGFADTEAGIFCEGITNCTTISTGSVIEGDEVKYFANTEAVNFEIEAGDRIGIFVIEKSEVVFE
jgi:hypothetical protein